MRFCECVRAVQETPVRLGDFNFEALQEEFQHEALVRNTDRYPLTVERILYEVSHQCWVGATGLSKEVRDYLTILIATEAYPVSLYLDKLGWVIIRCEGSIRDLIFAQFQERLVFKYIEKNLQSTQQGDL